MGYLGDLDEDMAKAAKAASDKASRAKRPQVVVKVKKAPKLSPAAAALRDVGDAVLNAPPGQLVSETAAKAPLGPPRVISIPYTPRNWAKAFHASMKRWAVMVMHRRAGKSTSVINHHVRAALDDQWERRRLLTLVPTLTEPQLKQLMHPPGGRLYGHILPEAKQAKLTMWDQLKYYTDGIPGAVPFESELMIRLPTGHKVRLFGADDPDKLRGSAFSGVSLDEYSQMPATLFSEVLSKGLADHLGYCIFLGTIKGKDKLYQTYQQALVSSEWFALWQDIDRSLATEGDATVLVLKKAMEDDCALIAQGLMLQAEYDQEWFLSPEAAIRGAWYGAEMMAAKKQGRLAVVPWEPRLRVDTDWDLGVDDATSIWFSQTTRTGEVRLIDYYENKDMGLAHYVNVLEDKKKTLGYIYGQHWAPHDIKVRDFGTGKTRLVTAKELGLVFETVPDLSFVDGVAAVRMLLPKCYFNETTCAVGIESLRQYRRKFNERMQEFTGEPVHNKHSHAADAFRGLAVRHKAPGLEPDPLESTNLTMPTSGLGTQSWMQ